MNTKGNMRIPWVRIAMIFVVAVIVVEFTVVAYPRISGWINAGEILPCKETDQTALKLCWEREVNAVVKTGNIDKALILLASLYKASPALGETCHSLTHEIGQNAYKLFARNRDFRVSPETSYCSYGFYHGFMEALVLHKGDMALARKFCDYVDKQLILVTPDATLQCFHGIGHGTVNNHDSRTWGSEQTLIDPAIALCEKVSDNDNQRSRCATGVFNGLSIFYGTGEYKLVLKRDDPLWVCRQQKREYQDACYISMNMLLLQVANWDMRVAASFVEAIPDDVMAQHAMINLVSPISTSNINAADHEDIVEVCRQMQSRLITACIQGYAFGFLEHGVPKQEYIKPLEFCESKYLSESEKNACFEYIFSYLNQWYSKEKTLEICQAQVQKWRPMCLEKMKAYEDSNAL